MKIIYKVFIQTSLNPWAFSPGMERSSEQTQRAKARKPMPFGHGLFIFIAYFFIFAVSTKAAYPAGCANCQAQGSWCVKYSYGYGCANAQAASLLCTGGGGPSVNCPLGCKCSWYEYTSAIWCTNNCIHVDSCQNDPQPTPAPPSGGCSAPGEFCVSSSWWTSGGYSNPTSCGQIGKSGSFASCSGGFCCSEPSGAPPAPSCFSEGKVKTSQCNNQNPCSGVTCCTGSCFTANQTQRSVADCKASCGYDSCWAVDAYCPGPPSCKVTINDFSVDEGETRELKVNFKPSNTTDWTAYFSTNDDIIKIDPEVISKSSKIPLKANINGLLEGKTTVRLTISVSGNNLKATCTDSAVITVNAGSTSPWWQVVDGDVLTNGNLISLIPTVSCIKPGCNSVFDLKGLGGFPGLPVFGGQVADFSAEQNSEGISAEETRWIANSSLNQSLSRYNYGSFVRQIPSDVVINTISGNINPSSFNSSTETRGYKWFKTVGDTNITSNITVSQGEKIILLVENGNLTIDGAINIVNKGNGFFMALVEGSIFVSPRVGPQNVDVEGIFLANGQFKTGTQGQMNDQQFGFGGSVAALGGVVLERNVGKANNKIQPSESFEYLPAIILQYPNELKRDRVKWEEVAP